MFRKDKKDKLIGFFKKNGFYLVLAVCVLGIGVGAFLGVGGDPAPQEPAPAPSQQPQQTTEQVQAIVTPKPILPSAEPTPAATPAPEESPAAEPAAKQTSGSRVRLAMPIEGEIIKAFSGDTLVYNPTLNMWMTHNGIDIAAEEGEAVSAALAGVVEEVKNDDSKGLIVTISHGSNGKTVYAGLKESTVKKDARINAGQPLGTAGTPAFESAQGPHLHFEYLVKDVYMDPVEYME